MLPASTPAVLRAIAAAALHATARSSPQVDPADLLLALLAEEDGRAATLAAEAGLNPDPATRPQPAGATPAGSASSLPAPPLAASVESLLYAAREMAFDLAGEGVITSEALLLALLRKTPEAFASLAGLGLDPTRLESHLVGSRPVTPPIDAGFHLADTSERMETARVLDASANRAREALRILEDYARFVLDDAFLSGQCKEARHELTTALLEFAPPELVWARETQHDVGTSIRTDAEFRRESLLAVAVANLKRLQEALRSLEEFSKVGHPVLAGRMESLRYRSYTLERAFVAGDAGRDRLRGVRLYALLSAATCQAALDWTIAEAAVGGVGMVQLREKNLPDRELVACARRVRRWTRDAGVLFIVNDRPDVARLVGADGVHLGQDDLPVKDARRLLGPEAIIGVSTHTLEQVHQAARDGAHYIGVGPVFASATKTFDSLAGLDFVREAFAATALPAFAIGGIGPDTIDAVVGAGARAVAVGHAIAAADDPRRAAAALAGAFAGPS